MALDTDFFRLMPRGSTAPILVDCVGADGRVCDGTSAYRLEFLIRRDSQSADEVYNSDATGTSDTANGPRVFWQGDPKNGIAAFYPPAGFRGTAGDRIAITARVYQDATVFDSYPEERPLVELVRASDGR